ncbi:MAG: hypothetical protein R3F19_34705 [Verrucomicrobiales bacterium]
MPLVVPDETPEGPIQRLVRGLSEITRKDLRDACCVLVRRFAASPDGDVAYTCALLRLATGLQLTDVGDALHHLVGRNEEFDGLGELQQKAVISALLDLRLPLGLAFWRELAARASKSLGVLTFSGLLNQGRRAAFQVLPGLPDDETVADALYVSLDQHAARLSVEERAKVAEAASDIAATCQPQIRSAVLDWVNGQDNGAVPDERPANGREKLNAALAGVFSRLGRPYQPNPTSARLAAA